MRTSIRIIAAGITIGIFILLNYYWFYNDWYLTYIIQHPEQFSIEYIEFIIGASYWVPFIVLLASMIAIAFYFYSKSKRKTRIKL